MAAVPALLLRLAAVIDRQPVPFRWGLVLLLTGLVFAADIATGAEVAFSIFYLAPVTLAAWHLGWLSALATVVLSGLLWLAADRITGQVYSSHFVQYWNTLVRTGFFFIVAFTLTRLRQGLEHERELARTDPLTGVANSRSFRERAEQEMARGRRDGEPVTVTFLDVDGFKEVNDTLGHAAGDALLCDIARALVTAVREVDVVARMGGDEFALLLPTLAPEAAPQVIGRVRQALADVAGRQSVPIGFSLGVVTAGPHAAGTLDDLIGAADALMYDAKRAGGSRVAYAVRAH